MYLQCDARFNNYLTEKVNGTAVVEHTIQRMRQIDDCAIFSSLYECEENEELYHILSNNGVRVELSKEESVTKRYYDTVTRNGRAEVVIRVCGDQLLLDYELMTQILQNFEDYDYFYEKGSVGSVCADIVKFDVLIKMRNQIRSAHRYFDSLLNNKSLRRYRYNNMLMICPCRAKDFLGFSLSKMILEQKLDIMQLNNNFIEQIGNSALYESGILTSWLLGDSVSSLFYDVEKKVNPWWCESAVNFVKSKLDKIGDRELKVFEWGSGNSTYFFSRYAKKIVSIEHDFDWYQKLKDKFDENVELKLIDLEYNGEYCRAINSEQELFDIVSIDGRDRVRCVKNCIQHLSSDGIIIWDNSDRDIYNEGFEFLKKNGFKRLELSGIIWGIMSVRDYTSIFYRNNNIFDL